MASSKRCFSCRKVKKLPEFPPALKRPRNVCRTCSHLLSWRSHIHPFSRYESAKQKAKIRKLSFRISFPQFLIIISSRCHYCQELLAKSTGHCMDRIDNEKGYEKNNVIPCCGRCNQIRSNQLSVEEMQVAMRAVLALRSSVKMDARGESSKNVSSSQRQRPD